MKKLFKLIKQNILIILFLPILVPFFIYVRNITETPVGIFFRSALVSIALFIILLAISFLIIRNVNRTVLFASITFFILYLYGAIYDALLEANSPLAHHKFLGLIYLVFMVILAFVIGKLKISANLMLAVKVIPIIFIVIQLVEFIPKAIKLNYENRHATEKTFSSQYLEAVQPAPQKVDASSPDVYYIIFDSYSRNDMMKQEFGYDNTSFTDALKELGFYVADCSRSNYTRTTSSLSSSLNMNYLQDTVKTGEPSDEYNELLAFLTKNSAVFKQFETLGYKTISFETGFAFTEIKNADEYLEPSKPIAFLGSIHPDEILLLKNSIFRFIYDTHISAINYVFDQITFPYSDHVKLQYFMLDQLKQISTDPKPTFTFVHMTVPHSPYVFRADGSYSKDRRYFSGAYITAISEELFKDGYINQVEFVNKEIIPVIKEILANSTTPPIIILQGDHSITQENRFPNLNAYYLPGDAKSDLYPGISPVNSFRFVFDYFYGMNYQMLPDQSFTWNADTDFVWTLAPETMDRCKK